MHELSSAPRRRRALIASASAAILALAVAILPARAQPGAPQLPPWLAPQQPQPSAPRRSAPSPGSAPVPGAATVIARVDGRPITQGDFDRLARPYLQRLQSELGPGYTPEVRRLATFNVLDELIRRDLIAIEAGRRKVEVTQADIDSVLAQDPFFLTNGRFDAARLNAYKLNPGSNYLQVLPRLREIAAASKLDQELRRRFTPAPAEVRAEWDRRNEQVRFRMLPLLQRDISLEPESGSADWDRYYRMHPDEFMTRTRVRLRYARLPIPAEGDPAREPERVRALARARALADSLRHGTLPDTAAELADSGPFDLPAPVVPGLGRVPGLDDTLARIESDSTIRVVGPYTGSDAVVVGAVTERQPRHVPPLAEVLGEVKRRADAEKRRLADDAERRAWYDAHRDRWRGPRARLTRVCVNASTFVVAPPRPEEIARWYAAHGHGLFAAADSARALPPLDDSLRDVVRRRLADGVRPALAAGAIGRIADGLRAGRDPRALARAEGAAAETLTLSRYAGPDSVFDAAFVDSLLAGATAARGAVQGPRQFGSRWAVWRVDAADTAFTPPYEAVRERSDQDLAAEKRRQDEAEARVWFDAHRDRYRTPVRYGLDVVAVRMPPADSVRIAPAEIRREYDTHPAAYRQEEQVKARHILFMTRGLGPDADARAKTRADSLLAAIRRDGGDFAGLAKRFSQEPGAAGTGGDLGWFGRGRMVKEFEQAAFALKPGEISPVVKTMFGYHIIKVEDRRPAGLRPFDEVRDPIRARLAQARADSMARRSAEALRRRLAAGGDAGKLAAPYGGVVAATPIAANDPLPAIGFVPGLAQDLPAMTAARWAGRVYRAGDRYLVLRLRGKVAAGPAGFDEVKARAVDDMKSARRDSVLVTRVSAIRAALAAGASLDSLAAPYGGLRDSGLLPVSASFVPFVGPDPRVIGRALALTPGQVSDTLRVAQGVVWLRAGERRPGDPKAFAAASAALTSELAKQRYEAWIEQRRKSAKIEILRADLRGPRPAPPGL